MRAQLEILRETLSEWLQANELDFAYRLWARAEWEEKEGPNNILTGAELVMTFENNLVVAFHYGGAPRLEEELQDLAGGFGYYFEHGNVWNLGFYPLDNWPTLPSESATYAAKLRDPRWQSKRKRILRRCAGRCENCAKQGLSLEVHHCYYRFGRFPWQYPDATLLALCPRCHEDRGKQELKLRTFLPRLRTAETAILQEALSKSLYWYPRDAFVEFLANLGCHGDKVVELLRSIQSNMSHPEDRTAELRATTAKSAAGKREEAATVFECLFPSTPRGDRD